MSDTVSIMPSLDMQNGRVVKRVHFVDIAGDPVECAGACCAAGADVLAMLDITATVARTGRRCSGWFARRRRSARFLSPSAAESAM